MEATPRIPSERSSQRPFAAEEKEPLQVRIPVSVKRRFKAKAALMGLEPNALFIQVWQYYETNMRPDEVTGRHEEAL